MTALGPVVKVMTGVPGAAALFSTAGLIANGKGD
jgi:hypothetical protein